MTTNSVAAVFGASRGLGLLIAGELVDRGYQVVICSRSAEELGNAQSLLAERGHVEYLVCDVSEESDVAQVVAQIERDHGPIEVAITVAGVIQVGPGESMNLDHFREAIGIMLWGPIHVAWAVLPGMRARRSGRIGTVASVGGMVSPPHLLPYSTAKFGAVGFSDGLAADLAGSGVTATTIVPGLMRTGSHERAKFTGDVGKEYAWFAPAASLPGLSMNAERAARRIVKSVLAGDPLVVLTPLAWVGIRVRGMVPGTTTRVMGLTSRLLPAAPAADAASSTDRASSVGNSAETVATGSPTVEGRQAARTLSSPIVSALTTLGSRAARRYGQRRPSKP